MPKTKQEILGEIERGLENTLHYSLEYEKALLAIQDGRAKKWEEDIVKNTQVPCGFLGLFRKNTKEALQPNPYMVLLKQSREKRDFYYKKLKAKILSLCKQLTKE